MTIDLKVKEELENYLNNRNDKEKIKAVVISTYQLDQNELIKIKENFPVLKDYILVNQIDPDIVAGFQIKFGSKIIDLTIKELLGNFKKILYEIN